MDTLFIIGNGFDMAHDMKTSYLYFKKFVYEQAFGEDELLTSLKDENAIRAYLQEQDNRIFIPEIDVTILEKTFQNQDEVEKLKLLYQVLLHITDERAFWADFEEKLECFPFVNSDTPDFVSNQGGSDEKAKEEYAKELADEFNSYSREQLQILFKQSLESAYRLWREGLKYRKFTVHKAIGKDTIMNNRNAYFLNFNYTPTLEDYYGISEKVCHIHGKLTDDTLLFGHGQETITIPKGIDIFSKNLARLSVKMRKPVSDQLEKHESFFNQFSTVENVYFIGFGIREGDDWVDAPYIKRVFEFAPNANIYVDEYDKWNIDVIKEVLTELGAQKVYDLKFIDTTKDKIVEVK